MGYRSTHSICNNSMHILHYLKMALVNINEGLKEEYSMNNIFSAEYDFSCVRQIACADRFACARAITRVKRKGLMYKDAFVVLALCKWSI